jgi:hypothetical protein
MIQQKCFLSDFYITDLFFRNETIHILTESEKYGITHFQAL